MSQLEGYSKRAETLALQSMMVGLQREGHNIGDVTRLLCMCCDLERTGDYLATPNIKRFVQRFGIELYGAGQKPADLEGLEGVQWHPTSEKLTEHTSIIERRGQPTLIWYEPHHDLGDGWLAKLFGSNVFGKGSYLVDPSPEALDKTYARFASFEEQ